MGAKKLEKAEQQGLPEFFKLVAKLNLSNMMCIDGDGKINGRGCLGRLLPYEAGLLSEVSCGLFFRVGFPS